jgi:hypothetical protein
MGLNYEQARMTAHQLLIDCAVFNDREFGAESCKVCQAATLNEAGRLARRLSLAADYQRTTGEPPKISDIEWPTDPKDIKLNWSETVRSIHARH